MGMTTLSSPGSSIPFEKSIDPSLKTENLLKDDPQNSLSHLFKPETQTIPINVPILINDFLWFETQPSGLKLVLSCWGPE